MSKVDLRLELLRIAGGNLENARELEIFVLGQCGSGVLSGSALALVLETLASNDTDTKDPLPSIHPEPKCPTVKICTPKGIRIQRNESSSNYKFPDEILDAIDALLYSMERNLRK